MGELTRKDNSLCFRKNVKNVYSPVENTKEIYCFNEVSINTKLLDFLSQNNIIVHFFNYYGGYSGNIRCIEICLRSLSRLLLFVE